MSRRRTETKMPRSERIDARSRPQLMAWRRERVADLKRQGLTRQQIAERLRLTYRQVRSAEKESGS